MSHGVMMFDSVKDNWVVELNHAYYDLHCGESFELMIGSHRIPCRLELGEGWYIIMDDASLDLRACETYKINI